MNNQHSLSCASCQFYVQTNDANSFGKCHRYPPTVVSANIKGENYNYYNFPIVHANRDWCGEHKECNDE